MVLRNSMSHVCLIKVCLKLKCWYLSKTQFFKEAHKNYNGTRQQGVKEVCLILWDALN